MDPADLTAATDAILDRHFGPEGSPEPAAPEAVAEGNPVPAAEPAEPEAAAPSPEDDLGLSFRLADVPEEYREHVERYTKIAHGGFTKKAQELATQRAEAQAAVEFHQRLTSDETRDEALREFLAQHGYVMDDDTAEGGEPAGTDPPDAAQPAPDLAPYEQRLAALEARHLEAARQEQISLVEDSIEDGLDQLAETLGLEHGADLPAHTRQLVLGFAGQLPPKDGMPDMEGAIAQYEAFRAAEVQGYVNSKRVPDVDASGSSGAPKFDARNPKERLKAMEAIVGRHHS